MKFNMGEIYKNLSLENIEGEEWRDVIGYNGLYQISSYGRVKSLRNKYGTYREKILKQLLNKFGYLQVNLNKEGKMKTFYVHRLVAQVFIDNPNNHPQVNHKNEDKTDNCVDNLEWCTQKYNLNYGSRIAKAVASTDYKSIVEKRKIDYKAIAAKIDYKARTAKMDYKAIGRKNAEKLSKQVYQYDLNGKLIKIWQSTRDCSRNGYKQPNVSACCRNRYMREGNNVYKGYIWSYTEL